MDRTRRSLLLLLATKACARPPVLVGIDNPALPAGRVRRTSAGAPRFEINSDNAVLDAGEDRAPVALETMVRRQRFRSDRRDPGVDADEVSRRAAAERRQAAFCCHSAYPGFLGELGREAEAVEEAVQAGGGASDELLVEDGGGVVECHRPHRAGLGGLRFGALGGGMRQRARQGDADTEMPRAPNAFEAARVKCSTGAFRAA